MRLSMPVVASVNLAGLEMQHSLPQNEDKVLYLYAKNPWIVYDDIKKRVWLVSAVNLVHYEASLTGSPRAFTSAICS